MADELDDLTDEDSKLEFDFALDELELVAAIEALLVDRLLDEAELGAITTAEDKELLTLEELVVRLALDVLDELVVAAELVLLDELLAIEVLLATEELVAVGSSLGKLVGVEVVVVPPVPAPPPPQALNITAAANSSERDFKFIIQIL